MPKCIYNIKIGGLTMSTNPYSGFIENSTEQIQKTLKSFLDQQLQYQQWTESLLEEQANQWTSLNEKIQTHQKAMTEQVEQLFSLFRDSNPTSQSEAFNQFLKQAQDQITLFQTSLQNTSNPYQNFYSSMQTFLNQQQETVQKMWAQPSKPYASQWNSYIQEFQKHQEDWLKQFRDLPFSTL
jgi:ATP-dependent Clp protease ATP-binding subunit ClpA